MYCLCVYEHANCMDTPCIGGSKGGWQGCAPPPPGRPNSFIFMQFSAKNLQNNRNFGVGAPRPRENPGSAPAMCCGGVETCIQQILTECIKFLIHWSNTFTISAGYFMMTIKIV